MATEAQKALELRREARYRELQAVRFERIGAKEAAAEERAVATFLNAEAEKTQGRVCASCACRHTDWGFGRCPHCQGMLCPSCYFEHTGITATDRGW